MNFENLLEQEIILVGLCDWKIRGRWKWKEKKGHN